MIGTHKIMSMRQLTKIGDKLIEWKWNLSSESRHPCPASWPIILQPAGRLSIRWPRRYDWIEAGKWVDHLKAALAEVTRLEEADIPQPTGSVVATRWTFDGVEYEVAIDYSDYANWVDKAVASKSACYFKMQFRDGGYNEPKIVPGGYFNHSIHFYKYISRLRDLRRREPVSDVYGRFGTRFSSDIRMRAVSLLGEHRGFKFLGGTTLVRHTRSLREAARSRICVDLPGNGDLCFRLIDYLAMGACVIGPRPRVHLPAPLVHGVHVVHCSDDLSDLVGLCDYYLSRDCERDAIARGAAGYFDRYLHKDQIVNYYINIFINIVGHQ